MSSCSAIWHPDVPFPAIPELALPQRIEHLVIHRGRKPWAFLHESAIVRHRDRFFVAWNQSPEGESEKGTVVRWISADDAFETCSAPRVLAPAWDTTERNWESVQFLSRGGELWAFLGVVRTQPHTMDNAGGRTVIFRFEEAEQRWIEAGSFEGFHPLNPPSA